MNPRINRPTQPATTTPHTRTAYALAFFSGVAALVYQVVWVKILALSFGSTSAAAAAVISSFMAGLGLGAWLYRHLEARGWTTFAAYGGIEIGIAVTAAAITPLLYQVPPIYASLTGPTALGARSLFIGFAFAFVTIVIPSLLMGATFPALCRAVIRSAQGLKASLGPVYGLNTIGSAAGAIIAGFVLVQTFGNLKSVWLANGINLLVGLTAIAISKRASGDHHEASEDTTSDEPPISHGLPTWIIAATLILSGFATMTYEILWFRAAKYLVGNSTYALSVVLAVFLIGLGIGGLLHRRIIRSRFVARELALCQLGIAVLALLAMALESWAMSSNWIWVRTSVFAMEAGSRPWSSLLFSGSLVCAAVLLPPTLCMGLSFPLASSLYVARIRVLGRNLGSAYLLANLGSIAGVIVGALVILPQFGTVGGTRIVAILNVLLGLLIVGYIWSRLRVARVIAVAATAIVAVLALLLPAKMAFRGELERQAGSQQMLYWEEGDLSTVKVLKHPLNPMQGMTIDGFVIGVNLEYGQLTAEKQLILAHLPMVLAPDSKTSLNIGLGSATTLAELGSYASLDTLDCVEISKEVVEGARYFKESEIFNDPRTRLFVDDAVHHLRTHETTYDIIISDAKQNPQFPGNSTVLSREFLKLCHDRLADDGIMVQWSSLSYDPGTFAVILRTFMEAFEHVSIYWYPSECMVMVGTKVPLEINPDRVPASFASPVAATHLGRYFISSPIQLLAGWVTDKDGLKSVVPEGPVNTWDDPALEFMPQTNFKKENLMEYYWRNIGAISRAGENTNLPQWVIQNRALGRAYSAARIMRLGMMRIIQTGDAADLQPYCERALQADSANSLALGLQQSIPRGFHSVLFLPGRN